MKKNENTVLSSTADGIARIKLNDPSNYNALSSKTLESLINIFKKFNKDNITKVMIIEGLGKGFSAGHDLNEIKSLKKKIKYKKLFKLMFKTYVRNCRRKKTSYSKSPWSCFCWPAVSLVASCDLAISSDDAIFATPGVNIGLFCSTPMVAVSRKVTRKKMMKMLLTGESINAKLC